MPLSLRRSYDRGPFRRIGSVAGTGARRRGDRKAGKDCVIVGRNADVLLRRGAFFLVGIQGRGVKAAALCAARQGSQKARKNLSQPRVKILSMDRKSCDGTARQKFFDLSSFRALNLLAVFPVLIPASRTKIVRVSSSCLSFISFESLKAPIRS